jgi:TolA-binding protein
MRPAPAHIGPRSARRWAVPLLALAWAATAWADDPLPTDAPATAPPPSATPAPVVAAATGLPAESEVRAYQEVQGRFRARMSELVRDTRNYIDERQAQETGRLKESYDVAIAELAAKEIQKRDLAIDRFEEFLLRYPDSEYSSHVRFRLADLYWERSKDEFLKAQDVYFALEEELTAKNQADLLPEEPRFDLSKTIGLYERIIADNEKLPPEQRYAQLDGVYYSLAYVYIEDGALQYDSDKAQEQFQRLVQMAPNSDLVDISYLNIGNSYFEQNKLDDAIREYQRIYDKGPDNKLYDSAMYKLAWSYYRKAQEPSQYEPALALFVRLLDFSEQKFKDTGKRSDYAPDAIKYAAWSFGDMAEFRESALRNAGKLAPLGTQLLSVESEALKVASAVSVAEEYFNRNGARDYEWDIYRALAKVEEDYARFAQCILVYRKLQDDPRFKLRPEAPEWQMKIVRLFASGSNPDLEASGKARIEMTERFNEKSEWWNANRFNPEALSSVRRFIEESLGTVAKEYAIAAQNTGDTKDYELAASKFQEYLDNFPLADNNYEMEFLHGEMLYRAKKHEEAVKVYQSLVNTASHHPYGDGAVFQLMRARQEAVVEKFGPFEKLPEGAEVEKTYLTGFTRLGEADATTGQPAQLPIEITVHKLAEEQIKYIESADTVLAYPFKTSGTDDETKYAKFVTEKRPVLMYFPAQLLYTYHLYEPARERARQVIKEYPQTDEALYAASLIIDSYQTEGNLAEVRKYTKDYLTRIPPLGPPGKVNPKKNAFCSVLAATEFQQAEQLSAAGQNADAAEAFLAFFERKDEASCEKDPKLKADMDANKKAALYNAANRYEIAGKAEKANELFERYVNVYREDDASQVLYYRIAANYESTFQLDKAVDYYGRLLKYSKPTDRNRPAAQFNRSFLLIGLGKHAEAAQGFEDYGRMFPGESDVEAVFYQAGAEWERVSPAKAIDFYKRYRDKFGTNNPDHLLAADDALAKLDTRNTAKWQDTVLTDWKALATANRLDGVKYEGKNAAAKSAFRAIQVQYDKFVAEKLTQDDKKDMELIARKRDIELAPFREGSLAEMSQYGDFEWLTATLYLRAEAFLYYAQLGFDLRPPKGLSEDDAFAFQQVLDEQVYPQFQPFADKGREELVQLITLAKEKKLNSPAIGKAYDRLNALDPASYPAEKRELRGAVDATLFPEIRALTVPEPKPKEEGTP